MKNLLLPLFVLFSLSSNAQHYYEEGQQWNWVSVGFVGTVMSYGTLSGDTMINNVKYQTILQTDSTHAPNGPVIYFVHQDTVNRTLTERNANGDLLAIYDYNLTVGDSVWYDCQFGPYPPTDSSGLMIVDSVTTFVDMQSNARKQIHFSAYEVAGIPNVPFAYWTWIEGFGSTEHFAYAPCLSDVNQTLVCVSDSNNAQLFQNPNVSGCVIIGLSENQQIPITVYPNPSSGIIHLEVPAEHTPASYQVISVTGRTVLKGKYESPEIDLTPFTNGEYIVRLFDNTGQSLGYVKVLVYR